MGICVHLTYLDCTVWNEWEFLCRNYHITPSFRLVSVLGSLRGLSLCCLSLNCRTGKYMSTYPPTSLHGSWKVLSSSYMSWLEFGTTFLEVWCHVDSQLEDHVNSFWAMKYGHRYKIRVQHDTDTGMQLIFKNWETSMTWIL